METYFRIFTDIWCLFKKYKAQHMTDEQWSEMIRIANAKYNTYTGIGQEYGMLFRSLFDIVQEFYEKR